MRGEALREAGRLLGRGADELVSERGVEARRERAFECGSATSSFFTPSGKTGTICSLTHFSVSSGVMPRCVGHSASTSTNAKPRFSTCSCSAFLIAFCALLRCLASKSATRSTYTGPSSPAMSSAIFIGWPMQPSRPSGLVAVFWPMSVVGAIWPPVMP